MPTSTEMCVCGYAKNAHTHARGCIGLFLEMGPARKGYVAPEAKILRILKDLPDEIRLDVLAVVCAAFTQTNGRIS